jgi:acyl carrier protein
MAEVQDIKRFIVAEFAPDVAVDELDADYDLLENGVVDSLRLLQLIEWVGERYDLPVADLDLSPDSFRSVHAIQDFITGAGRGPAPGTTTT